MLAYDISNVKHELHLESNASSDSNKSLLKMCRINSSTLPSSDGWSWVHRIIETSSLWYRPMWIESNFNISVSRETLTTDVFFRTHTDNARNYRFKISPETFDCNLLWSLNEHFTIDHWPHVNYTSNTNTVRNAWINLKIYSNIWMLVLLLVVRPTINKRFFLFHERFGDFVLSISICFGAMAISIRPNMRTRRK